MTHESVGVVGAGVIGAGVAQSLAQSGLRVVLTDLRDDILERARSENKFVLLDIFNPG